MNTLWLDPREAGGNRLESALRRYGLLVGTAAVVVLLPAPFLGDWATTHARHVDVRTHAAIELFCGVTALLIASLIGVLSRQYHRDVLRPFFFAFLFMGLLDLAHAATDPSRAPGWFVASHTLSTLSGAVLLCAGTARYFLAHHTPAPSDPQLAGMFRCLLALFSIALGYHLLLPAGGADDAYGFALLARRAHEIAGLLYAGTAILAVIAYRATGQSLVLAASVGLFAFAQSAYLFRYSLVWDDIWWTWHAVKATFYVSTLAVIAAGLVIALRAVERARRAQLQAHGELRHAHGILGQLHRELQIRNEMVAASVGARDLDQTLMVVETALGRFINTYHCELILCVPEDERAELQRELQRRSLRWPIGVISGRTPCTHLKDAQEHAGFIHTCESSEGCTRCLCLTLQAHDRIFGYVRCGQPYVTGTCGSHVQLEDLAAEIGPIVHNALLHHRWQAEITFRSALSRVAGLLNSSLHLNTVLASVCRESARLLDSDGAAVVLMQEDEPRMRLANQCVLGAEEGPINTNGEAHWLRHEAVRALFSELDNSNKPVTLIRHEHGGEQHDTASVSEGCYWGAMAMFPMQQANRLMAFMIIMRRASIPFSNDTITRGELLAEQVRVAIMNADAYEALQRTNARLQRVEEERSRAERLASLGQMAASIAHEIRNPLSAINNCLGVLRHTSVQPKEVAAIEIIHEEVQRLTRLTHNFLSFGRAPVRALRPVVLEPVLRRVCDGIEAHISNEGVEVKVSMDVGPTNAVAMLDADGFQEVLWNLLLNAVQAVGPHGEVRVRVRARERHLFVAVADTGTGVVPSDRTRIFEPFHSQRSQGAGLGLAIVRRHVEAWGARLRIWGPPGACFTLYVPLHQASKICKEANRELIA